MRATILKGNMGYDQYTVPDTVAVESYLLLLSFSIRKHTSIFSHAIFHISLKNKELKTTHNTFRDCRVHFFRQPFSK